MSHSEVFLLKEITQLRDELSTTKKVLGTLITWLYPHTLNQPSTKALLEQLSSKWVDDE